jgi:putative toxin-antitoxin system antitoxin component (TIGR02293 family)
MELFGLSPDPELYRRITEKEGLSTKNLNHFLKATGLQEDQIISILGVVPKTMERRMDSGRLHPDEADKLFQVAQAMDVMIGFLGSARRAMVWFKTPQETLDDQTPLEKCRTETGRRLVNDEVIRIIFNVY